MSGRLGQASSRAQPYPGPPQPSSVLIRSLCLGGVSVSRHVVLPRAQSFTVSSPLWEKCHSTGSSGGLGASGAVGTRGTSPGISPNGLAGQA